MAVLRLFAAARDAAGTGRDTVDAATVGAVLAVARERYGPQFSAVVERCAVWCNGEVAQASDPVGPDDEVAVLPPVSGGCEGARTVGAAPAPSMPVAPTAGSAPAPSMPVTPAVLPAGSLPVSMASGSAPAAAVRP